MSNLFQNDLSDGYGPMTIKELRQGLRRRSFVFPYLLIHAAILIAVVFEFYIGSSTNSWGSSDEMGMLNPLPFFNFQKPYWMVAGFVCIILVPFGGMTLMSQELEEGNHELLQLTSLSRWQIVRGKFLMLWGLCLLVICSLLPYLIIRYFIGGIHVGANLTAILSLVAYSAMSCACILGVSSFKTVGGRIGMLILVAGSMLTCTGICLAGAAAISNGIGVMYHLNASLVCLGVVAMGISLARSRIRLVVSQYEAKPSSLVVGAYFFAPFIVGMATAMTGAFLGAAGMVLVGIICVLSDASSKAPAWAPASAPNIPKS